MNHNLFVIIAASAIFYGTPIYFAALGEVLTERSGVLNLGVEGMMLIGAVTGSWTSTHLGGPSWFVVLGAIIAGALAAALCGALHGLLVITLRANQTVAGLALTIFAGAVGLSSYLANSWHVARSPALRARRMIRIGRASSSGRAWMAIASRFISSSRPSA